MVAIPLAKAMARTSSMVSLAPAWTGSEAAKSERVTIHKNRRMMVFLSKIGGDGRLAQAYIEGRIVTSPVSSRGR
jgi:hypothetical protein